MTQALNCIYSLEVSAVTVIIYSVRQIQIVLQSHVSFKILMYRCTNKFTMYNCIYLCDQHTLSLFFPMTPL